MNHFVPDFEMDEDYTIPATSALTSTSGENEIMELLWQNGPVAIHPNSQRSLPKSTTTLRAQAPQQQPPSLTPQQSLVSSNTQVYMPEEEMATWLHSPMEELYNEFLYSNNPVPPLPAPIQNPPHEPPPITTIATTTAYTRQPDIPPSLPPATAAHVQPRPQPTATRNFQLFSRLRGHTVAEPPLRMPSVVTVVDSSATPTPTLNNMSVAVTSAPSPAAHGGGESIAKGGGSGEMATTMASSSSASGGTSTSGAAAAAAPDYDRGKMVKDEVEDRKRKRRDEFDDSLAVTTTADSLAVTTTAAATTSELHSEDIELESGDEKKHTRGSSASKRTRAAEVHNLSERRRRDRINERMRALQELIPRCNKSDKASMLDEAIDYLKSLQMQVQMMTMGCGMVPMMYPGMQQQYMPAMGMGMPMGMDMGMPRPMMPYPPAMPASVLPTAPAAAITPPLAPQMPVSPPLAPRMPISPFPITPDLSRSQTSIQTESSQNLRPYVVPSSGFAQFPSMPDPYQQYAAFQQMQMQMQAVQAQSQSLSQPGSSKPTTSKTKGNDNEDD